MPINFLRNDWTKNQTEPHIFRYKYKNSNDLHQSCKQARCLILNTPIPKELASAITNAYYQLSHDKKHEINTREKHNNQKETIRDIPVVIRPRLGHLEKSPVPLAAAW
jgi:phosphoenolpyruvate synthase/pyruvate phosphate dikinase